METERLRTAESTAVARAVDVLRAGHPVAFPTDTVYGVGALAWDEGAVHSLFRVKERDESKAIPFLIATPAHLAMAAIDIPPTVWLLARRFWPGSLTLVLRKNNRVPHVVSGGGETVAIRVPDHPLVIRLIRALDAPLAVTSANRSGEASPVTPEEVLAQLDGRIPLLLDGGTSPGGVPSTVLDMTMEPPTVLRRGSLGPDDWRDLLPYPPLGSLSHNSR